MKESIYILRVLFLKLICEVNTALLAMHLLQTTIDTKNYLYYSLKNLSIRQICKSWYITWIRKS